MPDFIAQISWAAVLQIIAIDILLGGDNAVVIALACRRLPSAQRRLGILWGTAGAIVLRVALIFFALELLRVPGLKLVGGALLLWIGVKLLVADEHEGHGNIAASDRLWGAVKTVIVADLVMSLDNVVAIAGAAETAAPGQQLPLVVFGLVVSIPIIVWGSQLVIRLMDRFPWVITGGAMLLGWIAGTMAVGDPLLGRWWSASAALADASGSEAATAVRYAVGAVGALGVLAVGKWLQRRRLAAAPADSAVQ